MEQHNPIKRSKAFVQFSRDHHFGLLLVWRIRQDLTKGTAISEINNYIYEFFIDDLQLHFKEEEELMFSKLDAADPLRVQAENEHEAIYQMMTTIQASNAGTILLRQFADLLEAHIRFEERTLFNHLQQHMTPEEQEVLSHLTAPRKLHQ